VYLKCGNTAGPLLKQLRSHERLQAEFAILQQLWPSYGEDSLLGVAQPLNYYPEFFTLATLEVPGIRLRRLVRQSVSSSSRPSKAANPIHYMALCGTWLQSFQTLTSDSHHPFAADELVEYCEERLSELTLVRPALFSANVATQIIARLARELQSHGNSQVPLAGCHGDFMTHNVMVHNGSMRVIDFTMFELNSIHYDACSLWSEFELKKLDVRANTHLLSEMQDAFLAAYQWLEPQDPLFRMIHIRHLIVHAHALTFNRSKGLMRQLYNRRIVRLCLNRLQQFIRTGI
jgi:hypothetical protein